MTTCMHSVPELHCMFAAARTQDPWLSPDAVERRSPTAKMPLAATLTKAVEPTQADAQLSEAGASVGALCDEEVVVLAHGSAVAVALFRARLYEFRAASGCSTVYTRHRHVDHRRLKELREHRSQAELDRPGRSARPTPICVLTSPLLVKVNLCRVF